MINLSKQGSRSLRSGDDLLSSVWCPLWLRKISTPQKWMLTAYLYFLVRFSSFHSNVIHTQTIIHLGRDDTYKTVKNKSVDKYETKYKKSGLATGAKKNLSRWLVTFHHSSRPRTVNKKSPPICQELMESWQTEKIEEKLKQTNTVKQRNFYSIDRMGNSKVREAFLRLKWTCKSVRYYVT